MKTVYRIGDMVKIITPKVLVRVVYPKTVWDYFPEVENKVSKELDAIFEILFKKKNNTLFFGKEILSYTILQIKPDPLREKIKHELAYALAKKDGFGGRERSLHLEERPEILGKTGNISDIRSVTTGRYYPPSGYGEDYESGGLENQKVHRIAHVILPGYRTAEIPTEFLEKII